MKKILMFAAPLALVACSEAAVEEPVVEDDAMAEGEVAAMVTANGTMPGTHEVVGPDGSVGTSVLNADGTHSSYDADGNVTEEGTWWVADGQTCFSNTLDPDEEGPTCWDETPPAEDGSFTATNTDGESVTVRPVAM
ncbi:hypothetical protein [Erythrobacter alti]|uniref:hypothetical protein n=1 Tax=Erythrobacter alti TaxID=1896145 RepID=UPI0030F41BF7